MKLGLSTIMHRDRRLDRHLMEMYQQAGVDSIELTDYHPDFSFEDLESFEALGRDLADLELHLNSLHIHLEQFHSDYDLAALNPEQTATSLEVYRKAVDVMGVMGGGILVTHDIRLPEPEAELHEEKRNAFLAHLRTLAAYAKSKCVRFALENTSRGYTRKPERLVALTEDLGAPNVGVVIDTGHRNLVGEPAEALRTVGKHLITLHIHDNHGERDEHLLPGLGEIRWPEVLDALRDVDYQGVFMYELIRKEDLETVRTNFEALHS